MIYVRLFSSPKGMMLAMCDEELIGKVLKEGKIEIDLKQYASFYKGELMTEKEAGARINESVYSANVVGDRAVSVLVKKGMVKEDEVKTIQGVKYVHIFKITKA